MNRISVDRAGRRPYLLSGTIALATAVALWVNLGWTPHRIRLLLAGLLLGLALFSAWRWRLTNRGLFLVEALLGSVASSVLLFGAGLPLEAHRWVIGLAWIGLGVAELVARNADPTALLTPWTSGWTVFAGVVVVTFPGILSVQFTAVSAAWAALLGVLLLVQAIRAGRPDSRNRRQRPVWTTLRIALPGAVLLTAAWGYSQVVANTAAADDKHRILAPFYEVPDDLAPGEAGSLIRYEEVHLPDLEGQAYRVLFRSDDAFERPTASSGLIFVPEGDATDRPVVAWAHGTVGLGEACAPSRFDEFLTVTNWIGDALAAGYVVTAPDYAGAGGTGEGEKYMVLSEQGRDLLHAVRAAIQLPGSGAGNRFVTYGESQGGAVSIAAGALSQTVAPELELVGVGAVAAASDLATTLSEKWESPLATWLLGPHLLRSYTRYYPNLRVDEILTEGARNHYLEIADRSCVFDPLGVLLNPRIGRFLTGDPLDDPDWREALIANRAPDIPEGVPLFAAHGRDDPLIDPSITAHLAERQCGKGIAVTVHWMEGVEHIGSANVAAPAFLDWATALFTGSAAHSDCNGPT